MGFTDQLLIGIIGLIVGTLLGNEINRLLYRPKVIIKFKDLTPLFTHGGYFLSITVANYGRTAASNCAATISLFDIEKDDVIGESEAVIDEQLPKYQEEKIDLAFPRHQLITPVKFRELKNNSLCWSKLGNPGEIDINPGMMQRLDICRVQHNEEKQFWYLIFPSEVGWRKVRVRVKQKKMRGRILVCPSNEYPTIWDFSLKVDFENGPTIVIDKQTWINTLKKKFKRKQILFE